jgi:hypothetical protein
VAEWLKAPVLKCEAHGFLRSRRVTLCVVFGGIPWPSPQAITACNLAFGANSGAKFAILMKLLVISVQVTGECRNIQWMQIKPATAGV